MRKLIFLVLAVVVVAHFGFVAYMSSDRQATIAREEFKNSDREVRTIPYVGSEEFERSADEIAETSDAEAVQGAEQAASEPERAVKRRSAAESPLRADDKVNRSPLRSNANRVRIPAFPAPRNWDDKLTAASYQETITILYPGERRSAPVREEQAELKPSAPVRKENRSFVDRIVMPIFKKPYGFIKSIGSKLR